MESPGSQSLILTPTRELAFQVSQMLREFDEKLHRKCLVLVGGKAIRDQQFRLVRGWRVIIATPGRLLEFLDKDPGLLNGINLLIMDEYDKLLSLGFRQQVQKIEASVPWDTHRVWLSATEPEERSFLPGLKFRTVKIGPKTAQTPCEERLYFLKNTHLKTRLCLEALNQAQGQVIIFVANRQKANHLNGLLKQNGIPCGLLHGRLKQSERQLAFQAFLNGKFSILIATDIAGRGLDTLRVDLVINFNLPRNARDYIHRKGRAGRMGRPSRCLSFAGPDEFLPLRNLEKGLDYTIPPCPGYNDREAWLVKARAKHKQKVDRERRIKAIRRAQGLE
jgi:superfamily II DNA/RNA helicase